VARELLPLEGGGYVADTPGLKAFALWDIEPGEVDAYFREMAPLVEGCEFSDCTHEHEPGCAVRAAVEAGTIDPGRYDSYLRIRAGESPIER
jgi:ribosome biogenesis GTPase